jgi:hypothetical protein
MKVQQAIYSANNCVGLCPSKISHDNLLQGRVFSVSLYYYKNNIFKFKEDIRQSLKSMIRFEMIFWTEVNPIIHS